MEAFFQRVDRGTWMGHVIEHIALRNSDLGWNGCWIWKNYERQKHQVVYNVVFNYLEEKVGIYSAKAAVKIAEALIAGDRL